MNDRFLSLVDCALSEIHRRDSGYLSHYPLRLAPTAIVSERYRAATPDFPHTEVAAALQEGAARLTASGLATVDADAAGDPLSDMMFDSILDAFGAGQGSLFPDGPGVPETALPIVPNQDYEEKRGVGGTRYFIRRSGHIPLLLLSATGVPLETWRNLIGDPLHDFRIILIESRSGDIITGGITAVCDLAADADNIREVLRLEGIDELGILGWCNGAKVALTLARQFPGLVKWMALLSPALRNVKSAIPDTHTFESNFAKVIQSLRQSPELAPTFVDILQGQRELPAWDKFPDAVHRAKALFPLPDSAEGAGLLAPMRTPEMLLFYCRRIESEIQQDVAGALNELRCPVMLIAGSHDNMVDNKLARGLLRQCVKGRFVEVEISGAGHYIHSLQYRYFRLALTAFAADASMPLARRMRVQYRPAR